MVLHTFFTLCIAVTPEPAAEHFALVITNNRSLDAQRPDLQYADDDGAAYASLFEQLFGSGRVALLTRFDAASEPLHSSWSSRSVPPTRTTR